MKKLRRCTIALLNTFQHAVHIPNLNTAFQESLVRAPRGAVALSFGNHFLERAFNRFGLCGRAEQFLRAFDLRFIQHVMLMLGFGIGSSHLRLTSSVFIMSFSLYTRQAARRATASGLPLGEFAVNNFESLSHAYTPRDSRCGRICYVEYQAHNL